MNNTAVNLALPRIRDELGLGMVQLQWVSASYVLVLAGFTMLGGALGDRFNKRTVLCLGLLIYVAGSLLGAAAPTGGLLILSRVCAALGATVLVPVGLATLRVLARTPGHLAAYMSIWGLAVGLGMALGPVAGGLITEALGWRAFFLAMAVLGVIYLLAVRLSLPSLPGARDRSIHLTSHALLAAAMVSSTAFLIQLGAAGSEWVTVALLLAVVGFSCAWRWHERRYSHPVMPRAASDNPVFGRSMIIAFVNYLALGATLFISSLILQDLLHLTAGAAGIAAVPLAVATALGAAWAGRSHDANRIQRVIRAAALAIFSGVLVAITVIAVFGTDDVPAVAIAVCGFVAGSTLMGFGFGAANTPVNYLAMATLPKATSGVAGSSASASRQLGQSSGVATSGGLLGLGLIHAGSGTAAAYLPAGIEIAAASVVLFFLAPRPRTAGVTPAA